MKLSFRWFGADDPVTLDQIRQIPGIHGIVSALTDVPAGAAWERDAVEKLAARVDGAGLRLTVVESIPVHEDIKLGRASRDRLIENYARSIESVGAAGVGVICYNFMPVFDWVRTDLAMQLPDGSTALAFDDAAAAVVDLSRGTGNLPGSGAVYDGPNLAALLAAYSSVGDDALWENLAYFLERIIPAAEAAGVKMAIHPDDPPWPVFGLPRIITDGAALSKVCSLVDSDANGVTLCTGSLGANPETDIAAIARELGQRGKIHFLHARNVKVTGRRRFHETQHPREYGDVDIPAVMCALADTGFDGPIRPDHGRMIWGERGRAGYGLYDRALGAAYLNGLSDGLSSEKGNAL